MINIEVRFVGYLCIIDLINARKIEDIKVLVIFSCGIHTLVQAKQYSAYVYDEDSMIWWGIRNSCHNVTLYPF
jgi:hypothetical protein